MTKMRPLKPATPEQIALREKRARAMQWNDAAMLDELKGLADFIVAGPALRAMIGEDVRVSVRVSPTGRGVVFQVEPER